MYVSVVRRNGGHDNANIDKTAGMHFNRLVSLGSLLLVVLLVVPLRLRFLCVRNELLATKLAQFLAVFSTRRSLLSPECQLHATIQWAPF